MATDPPIPHAPHGPADRRRPPAPGALQRNLNAAGGGSNLAADAIKAGAELHTSGPVNPARLMEITSAGHGRGMTPPLHGNRPENGNCSELRGSEQLDGEGIQSSGAPGTEEGSESHLGVGALG